MSSDETERMSFRYSNNLGASETNISMSFDMEFLDDVLENFSNFLRSVGFTYVDRVSVLNEKGDDIIKTNKNKMKD